MKKGIALYVILFLLAFAVNGFAMGGGEQQQQEQQPGVQERAGEQDQYGQQQPMAGEQQAQQTFTGTVDRAGDNYILIMDGTAYELEVDDEEMVRGMVGQEVEVLGTLDGQTIQADTVSPSGQGMQQPMGGEQQPGDQQQPGGQQQSW